jgi:outer membrane protein OmpA-like peptidoglycan-associated protein
MTSRRWALAHLFVAAGLLSACGAARAKPAADHPAQDQIVLLPDPDGGVVGRAAVSNPSGAVDLAAARASTLVAANRPPSPVRELSPADVSRLFGDVLATLPPAPRHFTLYFRFESDELTDESRALVAQILQAVKERPAPEVVVVGHTDTTGRAATNFDLGLKRATTVRGLLVAAGLSSSVVDVTSHGEADLLIATPDDTFEPRNRRVEITVR